MTPIRFPAVRTDDFDYDLPPELIATHPLAERTASRMMVIDRERDTIEHHLFAGLPAFLRENDLLVFNDTRVIHKGHPRIICTNHNAGITVESTMRLDGKGIEQVTAAIEGCTPEHILNPEVLDHPRVKEWLKE